MKNCLVIFLLFVWHSAFSQLNDNFQDGNFSTSPTWKDDTSAFAINSSGLLQSNASTQSRTVSLSTENHLAFSVSWEFYLRLDFDPSSGNRLRIYLLSDNQNLKDSLNGYFIQVGEAGILDSYDLYRQSGTIITKVFDGPDQVRNNPEQLSCRLHITRNQDGLWTLRSDQSGGTNFKLDGSAIDDRYMETGYFGIVCQYTSTRSDKFFFDDFKIEPWQENLPAGYEAKINDVVINEIFADPEPAVQLPAAEFIELWNGTAHNISLKNWTYSDGSSSFKFGPDSIKANEHFILCAKADTSRFKSFGRVLGLSPWPALNNGSDHLTLKNEKGRPINDVSYADSWYQDNNKKEGGWSLELIDAEALCGGIRNWKASIEPSGGTPGRRNSVYKINGSSEPLKVAKLGMLDSISLAITYNRYTDSVSAADYRNYSLNNGARPQTAAYSSTDPFTIILKFSQPLTRGTVYQLIIQGVSDCSGTLIAPPFNSADLLLAAEVKKGDILISEILFNPRQGSVDFVEIYNNSSYAIDLQDLTIGNLPLPDTLNRSKRLSSEQLLLQAGEYIALSADPEKVKNQYFTENPKAFLKIAGFPTYNNDKGIVTILRNNKLVDQFSYTEKMHSLIIKDPEGISLERSSFSNPADYPGNFKSAAAAKGFATPGYRNSQYLNDAGTKDEFKLLSTTFSPDNDGFEDLMQINYMLSKPGYIANIAIYNSNGNMIRKLYNNFTLGTSGNLEWDGRNETAQLTPTGIYLLYAELFTTSGEMKKFRRTIVLANKSR